jgi:hypothetical protein
VQKDPVDDRKRKTTPDGVGYFHQVIIREMGEQEAEKTEDAIGRDMIEQMSRRKEIPSFDKAQEIGHGIMGTGKIGCQVESEEDKEEKKNIDGIGDLR